MINNYYPCVSPQTVILLLEGIFNSTRGSKAEQIFWASFIRVTAYFL
jgi:hypothetical protein